MKKVKYLYAMTILALLASCSKYVVDSADDFNVTTTATTYKTTDTVLFRFSGNPDYINYYSGEPGSSYEYATAKNVTPDSALLIFSTTTTAPGAATQPLDKNRVSLLVSTNFSGMMDVANIKAATWTDISASATWAPSTATISSGVVKVHQYRQEGKPLYIAFRYTSDTARTGYLPRRWVINTFNLRSFFNSVFIPHAGGNSGTNLPFTTGSFYNKSVLDSTNNWVYGNTSLTFNAPALGALPNEDWSISRGFDLTQYIPDVAVGIKRPNARLENYQYRFTKAGTYKVVFVAKNQTAEKVREVVRTITLTITN
jgi:hypothetical protein